MTVGAALIRIVLDLLHVAGKAHGPRRSEARSHGILVTPGSTAPQMGVHVMGLERRRLMTEGAVGIVLVVFRVAAAALETVGSGPRIRMTLFALERGVILVAEGE